MALIVADLVRPPNKNTLEEVTIAELPCTFTGNVPMAVKAPNVPSACITAVSYTHLSLPTKRIV